MPTTTYEAIRDDQIAAIVAITPTSHADVMFRVADDEMIPFRYWAAAHPQACYRRFAIEYLSEDIPEASNLDAENRTVTAEIVVAYPNDKRYGALNRREQSDLMRQDWIAINNAAGHRGYASLGPDATVTESTVEYERGPAVTFLVGTYRVSYWEAV